MSSHISVILIEDNPQYRESVDLVLQRAKGIQLTHQYGTAEQALHSIQYDSPKIAPDVILLDLNLPGISGIETIPWLKEYLPNSQIIVLTQSDKEADVIAAVSAGASGYLLKASNKTQITDAITLVAAGNASIDPKIAKFILQNFHPQNKKTKFDMDLSEREIEVLRLLGEGLVKKEIAEKLEISSHTVDNHIRNIYDKLQVHNAPAAITKAYKTGLFSSD